MVHEGQIRTGKLTPVGIQFDPHPLQPPDNPLLNHLGHPHYGRREAKLKIRVGYLFGAGQALDQRPDPLPGVGQGRLPVDGHTRVERGHHRLFVYRVGQGHHHGVQFGAV